MRGNDWRNYARIVGYSSAAILLLALLYAGGFYGGYLSGQYEVRRHEVSERYPSDTKKIISECIARSTQSVVEECVRQAIATSVEGQRAELDLKAQRESADWAWWVMVIGILQFFATLATLGFLKLTLDATLLAVKDTAMATQAVVDANEIAKTNAQRQLRPFVWPSVVSFEIDDDGEPHAYLEKKNFGATPAINLQGWVHAWIAPYPLRDALPDAPPDTDMSRTILAPGAALESHQPHGLPLDHRSLTAILDGNAALYFYGLYTFDDIFGNEHLARFIFFSRGERQFKAGRFSPYNSGNIVSWT